MGTPSKCVVCKERQLTSLPKLGELTHSGYCPTCAEDLARRSVGALACYERVPPDLLALLEEELGEEGPSRRLRRLAEITYPTGYAAGILVAISRIYQADAIEQHRRVLRSEGRVVFGKFRYSRSSIRDTPIDLENAGRERYQGRAVGILRDRLASHMASGGHLWLFILDPDPPAALWQGAIDGFDFAEHLGSSRTPAFGLPALDCTDVSRLIPNYYWLDEHHHHLRYHCNYWFLLSSLRQIDVQALAAMRDLETGGSITLGTSQLYPAEVSISEDELRDVSGQRGVARSRVKSSKGLSVPFGLLLKSLQRVRLTPHASRNLTACQPAMLRQLTDLLVRMERCAHATGDMGIRCRMVPDGHGLMEFPITSGGRVAAGWHQSSWRIVGIEPRHREGESFWNEMRHQWRQLVR